MSHTTVHKKKLQARISRIQGQLKAVSTALENKEDCGKVLQTLSATRGALNGLMHEVLEDHIQHHIIEPSSSQKRSPKAAALDLISVLRSYLK